MDGGHGRPALDCIFIDTEHIPWTGTTWVGCATHFAGWALLPL
jgi:hypothetical protein